MGILGAAVRSGVDQSWARMEAARLRQGSASFRLALEEKTPSGGQQGGTTFLAAVTIGYPLLDRNQRADTLASLADSLENAEEAYENAVENVVNLILETEAEVKRLERDKQIAWLSLRQAELEWEAARLQHGAGIIDDSALHSAELRLRQVSWTTMKAPTTA